MDKTTNLSFGGSICDRTHSFVLPLSSYEPKYQAHPLHCCMYVDNVVAERYV